MLNADCFFNKRGYGIIITPNSIMKDIGDVKRLYLIDCLAKYGLILFRGFDTDISIFSNLIQNNSRKVTSDPARISSDKNAQLIDAGEVEMGLHIENGSLPFLPDAQWFFCEKAASVGSQTIFCDGRLVWEHLGNKTKNKFLNRKIQYSRRIAEQLWKKYLANELELLPGQIREEHLEFIQARVEGQNYKLNPDGSVYSRFCTWAAHTTQFSEEIAFANSMLGPSVNYEPPRITWEDGSIISPGIFDEIIELTDRYIDEIVWEDGDIAVIDNTRIMHGRRKILDKSRRMYGGQSYF